MRSHFYQILVHAAQQLICAALLAFGSVMKAREPDAWHAAQQDFDNFVLVQDILVKGPVWGYKEETSSADVRLALRCLGGHAEGLVLPRRLRVEGFCP